MITLKNENTGDKITLNKRETLQVLDRIQGWKPDDLKSIPLDDGLMETPDEAMALFNRLDFLWDEG